MTIKHELEKQPHDSRSWRQSLHPASRCSDRPGPNERQLPSLVLGIVDPMRSCAADTEYRYDKPQVENHQKVMQVEQTHTHSQSICRLFRTMVMLNRLRRMKWRTPSKSWGASALRRKIGARGASCSRSQQYIKQDTYIVLTNATIHSCMEDTFQGSFCLHVKNNP